MAPTSRMRGRSADRYPAERLASGSALGRGHLSALVPMHREEPPQANARHRTGNPSFTGRALCQLSYVGAWNGPAGFPTRLRVPPLRGDDHLRLVAPFRRIAYPAPARRGPFQYGAGGIRTPVSLRTLAFGASAFDRAPPPLHHIAPAGVEPATSWFRARRSAIALRGSSG